MVMKFRKIVSILGEAAKNKETVRIYYPETRNTKKGWREVEPYSLTTDLPPKGEHLVFGEDHIRAGHILNAYNVDSGESDTRSFILGKIKKIEKTEKKFKPKWEVEF